jgi:alkylation response protein AidB-like acyl-CoA dehydrogenase
VGLFLGQALAAYEQGVKYAKEKTHRGASIGSKFEHIKISIADMAMKYDACKWYAYHLGFAADHYKDPMQLVREAALTKVFVVESAIVCKAFCGVHGSNGGMNDYEISGFGEMLFLVHS